MTSDQIAFIKDNKKVLEPIFQGLLEKEKEKVFFMPIGVERDIQIALIKFLKDWLYQIGVCSKPETPETQNFI